MLIRLRVAPVITSLALLSGSVIADDNILTGDARSACEAMLCLSTGHRPDECAPSLHRYFSITRKKLSDTIRARADFLKACPTTSEETNPDTTAAGTVTESDKARDSAPDPVLRPVPKGTWYTLHQIQDCTSAKEGPAGRFIGAPNPDVPDGYIKMSWGKIQAVAKGGYSNYAFYAGDTLLGYGYTHWMRWVKKDDSGNIVDQSDWLDASNAFCDIGDGENYHQP